MPALLVVASAQRYPELARLMIQERAKLEAPGDQVFSGVLVHLKGARVEYEGQTFALDPDDCDRPGCIDSLALLDGERPPGALFRALQGLVALCLAAIAVQLTRHTLRQGAAPADSGERPQAQTRK